MMRKIFLLVLCLSMTPAALAGVTGINYEAQTDINVSYPPFTFSDPHSNTGLIPPVTSTSTVDIFEEIPAIAMQGVSQGTADFLSVATYNQAYISSNGTDPSLASFDSSAKAKFEVSMATPWMLDIEFSGQNMQISNIPTTVDMLMQAIVYDSAMNPYSVFERIYNTSTMPMVLLENDGDTFNPGTYYLTLEISTNNTFDLLPGMPMFGTSNTSGGISAGVTSVPIPTPGAIMLGTLGAGLVGWLRRRRII